jgi:sporulation protein YlmC with PRC-barrel domain
LLRRRVVTESGHDLGRCYDLRGELTATTLRVTGICVGGGALLERFGIGSHHPRAVIPWDAIVRIEGKQIVVNDDSV